MIKYTLYIGLNDKDTKTQKIDTIEAFKMLTNLLLSYTDGATIYNANGIYKHGNGSFTVEQTLRVELLFVELDTVKKIIEDVKKIFNQESVALTTEDIKSELL
jgi:hypothetical protein